MSIAQNHNRKLIEISTNKNQLVHGIVTFELRLVSHYAALVTTLNVEHLVSFAHECFHRSLDAAVLGTISLTVN